MPLRLDILNHNCKESVILDPHNNEIEQLEELDLNSPIKKNTICFSPLRMKELSIEPSHPLKSKKKPKNKRDLKDLIKSNGTSPYLEYLPNMLNK
jgi:hypothetical protein